MNFIDIFKMLSDENRIRILNLLVNQELCVCEIEAILEVTQSNASRHLNRLKNAKIIDPIKDSQWTYYKINKDFIEKNKKLYEYLLERLSGSEKCLADLFKLQRYAKSTFTRNDMRENKDDVVNALNISCGCRK